MIVGGESENSVPLEVWDATLYGIGVRNDMVERFDEWSLPFVRTPRTLRTMRLPTIAIDPRNTGRSEATRPLLSTGRTT